jgi:hypothetical protein
MAADYVITNQRQTSQLVGGSFRDVVEVSFQATSGATGVVTIPLAQYTEDAVKEAVEARVQVMNAVHNL